MNRQDKRFVIQEHTAAADVHWDFMLESESGESLQTHRLDIEPQHILQNPANVVKIFDHSPRFLTYQGPVSKGRGRVRIVEAGTYKITYQSPNRIELNLNGQILKGNFILNQTRDDQWQFALNTFF